MSEVVAAARVEQETTVTQGRDDEFVYVWTNNPVDARKLARDQRAVCVTPQILPGGVVGGTYRIRHADFNVLGGFRRRGRKMTDEQRAAAVARLSKLRGERI